MAHRRRKNKKLTGKFLFLLLLVAAGAVCYFVWEGYFKDETVVNNEETTVVKDTPKSDKKEEEKKQEKKPESEAPAEVEEKEKVQQYDGDNPNESEEITGVITFADVVDGVLMIRLNIDQYLAGGNCTLMLERSGNNIYSGTVEVDSSAATSTCKGFDVAVGNLGHGETNIIIKVSSGGKSGIINGGVEL